MSCSLCSLTDRFVRFLSSSGGLQVKPVGTHVRFIRRLLKNPFARGRGHPVIHCSHHKVGTVWFKNVLRAVAKEYGLRVTVNVPCRIPRGASIFIDDHGKIDLRQLGQPYRGSHMIRDPRDVVISGYHYHLWTKERWANTKIGDLGPEIAAYWPLLPVKEIQHLSYKEYLNSLDKDDGLMAEISRASSTDIQDIVRWDYENPHIFNFKYEDIMRDEEPMFAQIFSHYGFNNEAIARCTELAMGFSFKTQAKRSVGQSQEKSHLRSGKAEQWRAEFSEAHKAYFKQLHGQDLIRLGYETDLNW